MHDLPGGPALLLLARQVLLDDLMPLLPSEHRSEALLVAKAMAIAEREAKADDGSFREIIRELEMLYGHDGPSPSRCAGPCLSPLAGERGDTPAELLRDFARDLRAGTFESSASAEHAARSLLWRLTIAKLRQANPQFLDAHGFGQPSGLVGD